MDTVRLAALLAEAMEEQAHHLRWFAGAEAALRERVTGNGVDVAVAERSGTAVTGAEAAGAEATGAAAHMQHVHEAIDELRRLADSIERSDNERDSVFRRLQRQLGVEHTSRLHDVIAWLPEKARVGVQLSFNSLRDAADAVRATSDRLGHLFRSVSGTMGALIGELLPGVSGAAYRADGKRLGIDQPSLLVDQHH